MFPKPKRVVKRFGGQVRTLIISAFGFVAALSWNDAIKSMIKEFVGAQSEWPFMVANALLVTFVAVFVTVLLSKE